jgi:hypothetical protein
MVQENIPVKGIRWDDILLRFEWSYEADQIRNLVIIKKDISDEKK